jgi:hypothetical protein
MPWFAFAVLPMIVWPKPPMRSPSPKVDRAAVLPQDVPFDEDVPCSGADVDAVVLVAGHGVPRDRGAAAKAT